MRWKTTHKPIDRGDEVVLVNRFRWWSGLHVDVFRHVTVHGERWGYSIAYPRKFHKYPGLRRAYRNNMITCGAAVVAAEREVEKFKEAIR